MKKLKSLLSTNKFKQGSSSAALTALVLVAIIIVNIVATALTDRFPSLNIDLTTAGLNSISEETEEIAVDVDMETVIYLIGDENEYKTDSYFSSYGIQYSQVSSIVEKICESNSYITYEYVDPDLNPTFMTEYASDDLSEGCVVVKTDLRYRVLTVNDFYQYGTDSTTGYSVLYSSVEGAISNALYISTLDTVPVVAIATGHEEFLSDTSTVESLLTSNAFDVVTFNILTEEIPEETDILFLPSPTTDYSTMEIDKIEVFLEETDEYRGLIVSSSTTSDELTNIDYLLAEWGIQVGGGVLLETDTSYLLSQDTGVFLVTANEELFDVSDYPLLISAYSSPIELLFSNNNGITTYPVLYTSSTTYEITEESSEVNLDTHITAALAQRYNSSGTETYVYVLGDTYSLDATFISGSTFDNGEFFVDILNYIAGTDDTNTGLYIESIETTSYDIVTTYDVIYNVTFLGFTIIVPLAIFGIGLFIFFRRRYL